MATTREHLSVDDARILPHLRSSRALLERERMHRAQADALVDALTEAENNGRPTVLPGALVGEPADLRGIPAIARGVGGVIPHTQPERETVRRLTPREYRPRRAA